MAKSLRVGPYFGPSGRYSAAPSRLFLDEQYIKEGLLYSTYAASLSRGDCSSSAVTGVPTTGDILATIVPLQEGMVVTNLHMMVGGTAAGTPTAGFLALYDTAATPALMEQTAGFGALALPANTLISRALNRPVQIPITGAYYVAFSSTATTLNNLIGINLGNAIVSTGLSGQPILTGTVAGSFGDVAPATISITAVGRIPYFACT